MPPIIVALLVLPLAAAALVAFVGRRRSTADLPSALILSGITGSVLTACFAFEASSLPIAPYETSDAAWLPIAGQFLLSLYVGFGLGVAIAAAFALPYSFLRRRGRKLHEPPAQGDPPGRRE